MEALECITGPEWCCCISPRPANPKAYSTASAIVWRIRHKGVSSRTRRYRCGSRKAFPAHNLLARSGFQAALFQIGRHRRAN